MSQSACWFLALIALSACGFFLGLYASRRAGAYWRWVVVLALGLLCLWGWLQHHPVTLVHLLPVEVLSYLEGTAGAPLFMLILGVAWNRSNLPRERKLVLIGLGVGALYFLRGGIWMVQTTPDGAFAASPRASRVVMQSQNFSCGPAACATALHYLGIHATEAEMARLTQARPGSGTTMIRMMEGLRQRLAGTNWHVELAQPDWKEIQDLPMPALASMRFQLSETHIVAILAIKPKVILIADPVDGRMYLSREQFEQVYSGQMLFFAPNDKLAAE